MRIRLTLALAVLAIVVVAAAPALGADTPPAVTVVAHPTVEVTTDRIAEIPFTLTQCATALDCDASIGLTGRLGPVTQTAPAAYVLGQLGDASFTGLRLTGAAWRALRCAGRVTTVIVDLPGGRRQVLGAETLVAPAAGAGRWCVGTRRLAPPCHGSFYRSSASPPPRSRRSARFMANHTPRQNGPEHGMAYAVQRFNELIKQMSAYGPLHPRRAPAAGRRPRPAARSRPPARLLRVYDRKDLRAAGGWCGRG